LFDAIAIASASRTRCCSVSFSIFYSVGFCFM
jgi:hypothetical protein